MVKRAGIVALVLLLLSATSSLAATTYTVKMVSGVYRPKKLTVALGDSVRWKNKTAKTRTATPLYQYAWSSVSVAPGALSSPVKMTQAGTFPYRSATGARMKGKIIVPMTVDPPGGNTGTMFTATMGTETTPGVMVHDVYVRLNGGAWYVRAATAQPTASFLLTSTGTWEIHSRLRWQLGGASSDWTPIVTVQVF